MNATASLRRVVAAAVLAGVVLGSASCRSRKEGLDPSTLPADLRADYALFAHRCSKCHSLARPLTSNISDDEQWVMYVNRMRRQPGSGISYDDQEHILRFLRYYAGEIRRKDAERKAPPPPSSSSSAAPAPSGEPSSAPPPAPSATGGGS